MRAENEYSLLKNWGDVYRSFQQFAQCDDGAIAEGYSDVIGLLLARDWAHFDELIVLTSVDKEFERFIVRHVNETIPEDAFEKIIKNTEFHCAPSEKRLCAQIRAATR